MTVEEFQKTYNIIGRNKEIRDLVDIVMQVAPSDISVLIYGESGVGKEVFARAIHGHSRRANRQLVSVNCGAIPEGILESELFGHKKGSFTGAVESRKGYFELADGGTLFLDEIAEMPLTTQVKLLRAIELQEFMPIGAETVTKVDVRYIAATNRDLQVEVNAKRFRQDLYFRLKAVSLEIPPLRKRKGDIEELANYFLNSLYSQNGNIRYKISDDAMELLHLYNWPGNVRELKNTVETAAALSKSNILTKDVFLPLLKFEESSSSFRNLPVSVGKSPEEVEREFLLRALFELKKDILELKSLIRDSGKEIKMETYSEILPLTEIEKQAITRALKRANGNKRLAAKMLMISERTLYRKIKEYDIADY